MKLFKRRRECRRGYSAAVVSDVGCLRRNNEDNYLLAQQINEDCARHSEAHRDGQVTGWNLAGVFDGMGGGEQGEIAARLAAQAFRRAAERLADEVSGEVAEGILRRAFQEANNCVAALREQWGLCGTTGTVVCTDGKVFKIFHMGDSRAYLLRNGALFQLTRDQTLAQLKLETGAYREGDPRIEHDRNKLTEYIGRDETRNGIRPAESRWISVAAGDSILLCSDGLYDLCGDGEILALLNRGSDCRERAALLVGKAMERGGIDNVTCLCMEFMQG